MASSQWLPLRGSRISRTQQIARQTLQRPALIFLPNVELKVSIPPKRASSGVLSIQFNKGPKIIFAPLSIHNSTAQNHRFMRISYWLLYQSRLFSILRSSLSCSIRRSPRRLRSRVVASPLPSRRSKEKTSESLA